MDIINHNSLLIVDDELSNLEKLNRTFRSDFRILQARSGGEAIDLLRRHPVDVIISDQRMPGMSGVELLNQSQKWSPDALRVILTGYTEVETLMDAINEGGVHRYITKPWEPFSLRRTILADLELSRLRRQSQLLDEQLRIAREVQRHLYPRDLPTMSGLDYAGACRAAGIVGGDYFDFLQLSPNRLCIAVGDISGKGIFAALLMASLQAMVRSHVTRHPEHPSEMFQEINRLLYSSTDDSKFATLFCGILDVTTGELTYANAGHNPPAVFSSAQSASAPPLLLEPTGMVLGIDPTAAYEQATVRLGAGDLMAVYTDGVVEAANGAGDEFGEPRLYSLIRSHPGLRAADLVEQIQKEVDEFGAGLVPSDDLTLVVVRCL